MADRLAPVAAFLAERPADVRVVALPFAQVEALSGRELPRVARIRRTWWAGRRAWRASGWRVTYVDLGAGWVEFVRAS